MAFNGSGVHNRVHDWTQDLSNTIPVTASRMDADSDDFSTALSNTICRDGQSTTTARIPFAAGTSAAAGTTASVSYAQTNDTNTGMYFPATDQVGLVAGGSQIALVTSSGITITGTLTPSGQIIAIAGTVGSPGISFASDLDCGLYRIGANNIGAAVNGAKVLDIGTAGLGVTGTLTSSGALTVSAGGAAVTGNSAVTGTLTSSGALTVSAGGAAITGNSTVAGTLTVSTTLTASSGFTVSAGAVSLPAGSVADAALALPGAIKLIFAQTASNSATMDFNASNSASAFDGTYDRLVLYVSAAKPDTDDVEFWIRIGTGAGPTYQTSGYKWIASLIAASDGVATQGSASDSRIQIGNTGVTGAVGSASGENLNARIEFDAPSASNFMNVMFDAVYNRADTNQPSRVSGAGNYATAGAVTALRLMFESGNIASGRFALYGIKKS